MCGRYGRYSSAASSVGDKDLRKMSRCKRAVGSESLMDPVSLLLTENSSYSR